MTGSVQRPDRRPAIVFPISAWEELTRMNDTEALTELNRRFIDAFRHGSWETLQPVLSPSFRYLDGATGELWGSPATSRTCGPIRHRRSVSISLSFTSMAMPRWSRLAAPPGPVSSTVTSTPMNAVKAGGCATTHASGRCGCSDSLAPRLPVLRGAGRGRQRGCG